MPSEVQFWEQRFEAARVKYDLSFGAFDKDKLVGFIIHGIDFHDDQLTAFNTGTGVLEEYRGQKLVDRIYDYALQQLIQHKIKKCMLEVIEENHVAIRVYRRIGFEKDRFLRCFKGEVQDFGDKSKVIEVDIESIRKRMKTYQKYYSWDHIMDTILNSKSLFRIYLVKSDSNQELGYFVINTNNGSLVQIEAFDRSGWGQVIAATKQIIPQIRINNVDGNRIGLIKAFLDAGLENHINQFEMTMPI